MLTINFKLKNNPYPSGNAQSKDNATPNKLFVLGATLNTPALVKITIIINKAVNKNNFLLNFSRNCLNGDTHFTIAKI